MHTLFFHDKYLFKMYNVRRNQKMGESFLFGVNNIQFHFGVKKIN
jgi:hypothetical protein